MIEKLDAILRHYHRNGEDFRPEKFVRHYDDAAAVISFLARPEIREQIGLPDITTLTVEMISSKNIRQMPSAADEAFALTDKVKRCALEKAHEAIAPMYWGERIKLQQASETIRMWISGNLIKTP